MGFATALLSLKQGHVNDRDLAVQYLAGDKSTFIFKNRFSEIKEKMMLKFTEKASFLKK